MIFFMKTTKRSPEGIQSPTKQRYTLPETNEKLRKKNGWLEMIGIPYNRFLLGGKYQKAYFHGAFAVSFRPSNGNA